MTSTPTTLKLKHDIKRIQELLAAKQIPYEEVSVFRTVTMCILALTPAPKHPILLSQVDLAVEPTRRSDMMLNSDGLRSLPQLHVNDKVSKQ